ncbi:hypothetical protein J2S55_002626 [Streptosporangium brasiliense]|uniref:Uncharacterized protein n=1 Tax=Streptosporangium brasiliense TaxID=47480 RepID=A0ABT9R4H2_9ACTN|nr:hypothetical protein [Streptosporangium brasiliense]
MIHTVILHEGTYIQPAVTSLEDLGTRSGDLLRSRSGRV